jgi:hypothetical protein
VEKTVDGVSTLYFRNALGQVVSELSGGQWTDYVNSAEGDRMNGVALVPPATHGKPIWFDRRTVGEDRAAVAHPTPP